MTTTPASSGTCGVSSSPSAERAPTMLRTTASHVNPAHPIVHPDGFLMGFPPTTLTLPSP